MRWDLFCRVIDNHGDAGVCWRLASDLAARGEAVRLWIDDASSLAWMAPSGAAGVTVSAWPEVADASADADAAAAVPGDVVVEAFGCELPTAFVRRMAHAAPPPVWINLEYLSAEAYVERAHRLPSPQAGAAAGLRKWFFYPGFTARTGGLLREPDLAERQAGFDAAAWLAAQGLAALPGERVVSLFCYEQPALPALIDRLAAQPTLLLAPAGLAATQIRALLGADLRRGALRAQPMRLLTQHDYDHLLWASDLNLVRGEDSFVRAQWAGKPFVWQIYPQQDGAHLTKLEAFLDRFVAGADADTARLLRDLERAWNAAAPASTLAWPESQAWSAQCRRWRADLLTQPDLTTQLLRFAIESR